jgi:hypothetical protein
MIVLSSASLPHGTTLDHLLQSMHGQVVNTYDHVLATERALLTQQLAGRTDQQFPLVVHFDINETILVGDEAGGDSRDDSIHKLLAKSSFVQIPDSLNDNSNENHDTGNGRSTIPSLSYEDTSRVVPTHWWNGEPLTHHPWEDHGNFDDTPTDIDIQTTTPTNQRPSLYIGWQWPRQCCPYYRTHYKSYAKTFVHHHGSCYQDVYHTIQTRLQSLHSDHPILSHMLPAFFTTLVTLAQQQPNVSIVLRTMGTDLPEVARALTAFAQGQHPDYPDFCHNAFVMPPTALYQGRWGRQRQDSVNDTTSSTMTNHSHINDSILDEHHVDDNDNDDMVYQLWQDDRLVASGDAEVVALLHQHSICGIQDDYEFWKTHQWEPWAGKPIWMLPDVQHILLDDNIHNLQHDGIAGVRKQVQSNGSLEAGDDVSSLKNNAICTFTSLKGQELLDQHGVHLIRVPTVAPILRPTWFLEQIELAQLRFMARHCAKSG